MEQNGRTLLICVFLTISTDKSESFVMIIDHPSREFVPQEGGIEELAKKAKLESLDFFKNYGKRFKIRLRIHFNNPCDILWEQNSSPKRCLPLRPNHCHDFWETFNSAGPEPLEDHIGE